MTPRRLRMPGRLIDRYLLRQMLGPLVLSLALVLSALVIERALRLIDMLADQGSALRPVLTMAANLLPHYLGLALPAAFFLSILLVIARLAEDTELDALSSSGLSLRRIALPFVITGVILALLSIALFGYMQPHARYGFRATLHAVTEGAWSGSVPAGQFFNVMEGVTFHAAESSRSGHALSRIFIEERLPDGGTRTTTARSGILEERPEGSGRFTLVLRDGAQIKATPEGVSLLEFDTTRLDRDLSLETEAFRRRGRDERELTLSELWTGDPPGNENPEIAAGLMRGELHGRLVRAASIVVLPLLALPFGMTAKRRRKGAGMAMAAIILVLYHHGLQVGQNLVEAGGLPPGLAIWLPFAVFTGLSGWILMQVDRRPGGSPLDALLAGIESGFESLQRGLRAGAGR